MTGWVARLVFEVGDLIAVTEPRSLVACAGPTTNFVGCAACPAAPFFAQRRVGDGRFSETIWAGESVPHLHASALGAFSLRKGWGTRATPCQQEIGILLPFRKQKKGTTEAVPLSSMKSNREITL